MWCVCTNLWPAKFFIVAKKEGNLVSGLDAATVPAGISWVPFGSEGLMNDMPPMENDAKLSIIWDAVKTVPVEVTNVVPGANDALYVNILGAQLTRVGRAKANAAIATAVRQAGGRR